MNAEGWVSITNVQLVRVMRVLTAIGLCDEVVTQAYAANEKTHFKTTPGAIAAEKHQYVFLWYYGRDLATNNMQL